MNRKEIGWVDVEWIDVLHVRDMIYCEHGGEPLG